VSPQTRRLLEICGSLFLAVSASFLTSDRIIYDLSDE
jgi:hypothetical protein